MLHADKRAQIVQYGSNVVKKGYVIKLISLLYSISPVDMNRFEIAPIKITLE